MDYDPSMASITYRSLHRYKYQLRRCYEYHTDIQLDRKVATQGAFVMLDTDGRLRLRAGYSWDGPSGPTVDTKSFMRGSLVHDALYQLMREGKLDIGYRKRADQIMREINLEDGMSKFRARYTYWAVRKFGAKHARPRKNKPLLTAP